jgi:hypothetical protein
VGIEPEKELLLPVWPSGSEAFRPYVDTESPGYFGAITYEGGEQMHPSCLTAQEHLANFEDVILKGFLLRGSERHHRQEGRSKDAEDKET